MNIHFDMPPRYHLYAQSEENRFNRPIEITFDLPKGVERIGKLKCPESMSSPTGEIKQARSDGLWNRKYHIKESGQHRRYYKNKSKSLLPNL